MQVVARPKRPPPYVKSTLQRADFEMKGHNEVCWISHGRLAAKSGACLIVIGPVFSASHLLSLSPYLRMGKTLTSPTQSSHRCALAVDFLYISVGRKIIHVIDAEAVSLKVYGTTFAYLAPVIVYVLRLSIIADLRITPGPCMSLIIART